MSDAPLTSMPDVPDLCRHLAELLHQIPPGCVAAYGTLAEALGTVKAARWVAEALTDPDDDVRHLCHRVVRRTGELGGYFTGRPDEKPRLLAAEGVRITDGVIDLDEFEHRDFRCERPLATLLDWQHDLAEQVRIEPYRGRPKHVAGVDVSYTPGGRAVGGYVVVEVATGRVEWSTTVEVDVRFPYIVGFLAFRELPVHLELFEAARAAGQLVPVTFVDGNGYLHPRRAGVACQLGVVAGVRTIGIGKTLLCGSVDFDDVTPEEPADVIDDVGTVMGAACRAKATSKPFLASPGHRVDVRASVRLARTCLHGHLLPEPIYHADRLSRAACR